MNTNGCNGSIAPGILSSGSGIYSTGIYNTYGHKIKKTGSARFFLNNFPQTTAMKESSGAKFHSALFSNNNSHKVIGGANFICITFQ
jgi:hypothetical protein